MSLDELVTMQNVILKKDRSYWSWVYKVRKWSLCGFMIGKEKERNQKKRIREERKRKKRENIEKKTKKEREWKREEVPPCS